MDLNLQVCSIQNVKRVTKNQAVRRTWQKKANRQRELGSENNNLNQIRRKNKKKKRMLTENIHA